MAQPTAAARTCTPRYCYFLYSIGCLWVLSQALGCGQPSSAHRPVEQQLTALTTQTTNQSREDSREVKGATANRKIIYTGSLTLAVKSLEHTEQEIKILITNAEGQLAEFREERALGNRRAARWKVRIPPARFNEFVDQAAKLGVAELRDVQKVGELKDVVTVEGELARIREEIERIEGRLRVLSSQIDLSTVSIYACEKEEFQPPTEPTFRDRVAAALGDSLRSLRNWSEAIVIAGVALAPWALLVGVFLSICWLVLTLILRLRTRQVQRS